MTEDSTPKYPFLENLGTDDFEFFKKFLENKYLPFMLNMGTKKRSDTRDKIRRCKTYELLGDCIYYLNQELNLAFNPEDMAQEFIKISKTLIATQNSVDYIKDVFLQDKKKGIHSLAENLCKENNFATFEDTDEIYRYKDGVYTGNAHKFIASKTQAILGELCSINTVNEVIGHVKRVTYRKREGGDFEPLDKLCLKNGILDLNTLEIIPHTQDKIFLNKLPVKYDKEAKFETSKIKKFFSEVLHQDDIRIIQEISGFCLYKRYFINKGIMFVGVGRNGKSTTNNLLKAFLGKKNCSFVSLQQLMENRFASANLYGKLANIYSDLSPSSLKDTGKFKALRGEDTINAEKKFIHSFEFVNYAKMIYSCNQIPKTYDESDAFFSSWIIINFPNQFLGKDADKYLLEKITTEEELSALLNWALDGLKRLKENGEFSNSKSINEMREEYIRLSDSVGAFNMDCIEISPDSSIDKKELYAHYCDYCRYKKYPIVAENTFHKDLQKKIRIEDYQPLIRNELGKPMRPRHWKGIRLNLETIKNRGLSDKNGVLPVPSVPNKEHKEQEEQAKSNLSFLFNKEKKEVQEQTEHKEHVFSHLSSDNEDKFYYSEEVVK